MVAVGVDALVDRRGAGARAGPPGGAEPCAQAAGASCVRRARPPGQRPDHESAFDPEVGADVVVADREREANRGQRQGGRSAERPLEQHRAGDRRALPRMPAGGLVDPDGVASDRGRQHLARGVGDEVGANEPGEPVVDPADAQQLLPAPRHRPDREHHDRHGAQEVAQVRVREQVQRPREVDLPDEVRSAEAGDEQRRADPEEPLVHARLGESFGMDRAEAYALGCAGRPFQSLLARRPRGEDCAPPAGAAVEPNPLHSG